MAVNGTITTAGAAYLSQRISAMATVTIDHFVMANVPGIDENTEADQDFVLAEEFIVATAPVYRLAHNGENSVVYSMVLDGNEGDYDFNWYGLVTNTGVILAFAHIPPVAKRANVGQVINRNFILPFTAAKALTGADIPSESWQFDFTETIAEVTVSLLGPTYLYAGDFYTYTFTDWDNFSTYSVSSDIGTATLGNGELTLDIPAGTPEGECLLTIIRNGSTRVIPIRIGDPIVAQPILIAPVNGAPNIVERPTLTMSPFKTFPANVDTHYSSDWELYDANDNLILSSYDDTTNKVSWKLPEGVLTEGGYGYKWRGRQNGTALGDSEWSEFFAFTTVDIFIKQGVVMPNGDIVVGQIDGYWYLIKDYEHWESDLQFGFGVSSSTGVIEYCDSRGFYDLQSGKSRTDIRCNDPNYSSIGTYIGYCRSFGDEYFLPNRNEVNLMLSMSGQLAALGQTILKDLRDHNYPLYAVATSTEGSEKSTVGSAWKDRYWWVTAGETFGEGYSGRNQSQRWAIPTRRIPV